MPEKAASQPGYHGLYLSYIFTCLYTLTGVAVLWGWQFDITWLKRPVPQLVAMNPLTAVCFIILGIAFLLVSAAKKQVRRVGYGFTSLLTLLSCWKLWGALTGADWQIDHFLFPQKIRADVAGRLISSMALNTALGFLFSGIALFLLHYETRSGRYPAHLPALVVLLFGFFSLLGYLYQAPEFYALLKELPMAVHTAACFVLSAMAIFCGSPQKGISREFTSRLSGSLMGRLLLPAALTVPVILGALAIFLHRQEILSAPLSITLLILGIVLFFSILITANVIQLNQKDFLQQQTDDQLRRSEAIFRSLVSDVKEYAIFMTDPNGNIVTWNSGAAAIKGYAEKEVQGKNISMFYTREDNEQHIPDRILQKAREKGRTEQEGWRVRKDGSVFWADVVMTALYTPTGELTGFSKVTRDMTERKKTQDRLSKFNEALRDEVRVQTKQLETTTEQLRQLSAHLQTAREEEKKNIAREIHDELGQMLTGLRMDMVWVQKHIEAATPVADRVATALLLLGEARQTLRRISTSLHPSILDDLGLVAALELQSRELELRTGIKVYFNAHLNGYNDMDIPPDIAIALYRIMQESFTNILKHAAANSVYANLHITISHIEMTVQDDGKGFVPADTIGKKTLGLVSIRERAIMINGTCDITSAPGDGTLITLKIPLQ